MHHQQLTMRRDGNTRLCTATAAASMRESFGSDGQPGSYTDIDYTDCIMLSGHNMAATQTVLWTRILDRLAGPSPPKIIVVDPRLSDTAKLATVHLKPYIGTNVALFNGLQNLMFMNDWVDYEWVEKHTIGLATLRETVKEFTPNVVEQITGVPVAELKQAAEILGTTKTLLSTALQDKQHQSPSGTDWQAWMRYLPDERPAHSPKQPRSRLRRRVPRVSQSSQPRTYGRSR
jgi:ferredoxin-nitrate reductase